VAKPQNNGYWRPSIDAVASEGLVAHVGASRRERKAGNLEQVGSLERARQARLGVVWNAAGQRRNRLDGTFSKTMSGRRCEGISTALGRKTWRRESP
jgi:hypothetical protein